MLIRRRGHVSSGNSSDLASRRGSGSGVLGTQGGRSVRLLEDALVDQIAAGEVVERPSSVVKELVENALDAGATRLRVEVRDGGSAWIAVTDDGRGMSPDDARLSLRRHATSKIQRADDLEDIRSFGFRGEALPAIASVSRLRLVTRPVDSNEAFELTVDAGRLVSERSVGAPTGTRVEVADLFGSVPARRKFLKRPSTEWGHIADWLTRAAMGLPGVHFEVSRDAREALVWPATDEPLDRIASLLSDDDAAALVRVEGEDADGHLEAFVSSPDRTRSNAQGLYLFVNGRPVRDRLLRHAVLEVYRDWLPRGRYPTAIVFLTVPPGRVDVNVHPAKWEVRFHDPSAVHRIIRRTLRDGISQRRWLQAGGTGAAPDAWRPSAGFASSGLPGPGATPTSEQGRAAGNDWVFASGDARPPSKVAETPDLFETATPLPSDPNERLRFGDLRLVGQFLASYLLVESKAGLVLVDQHAAHERVLYERLRAEWLERGVERQGLLVPLSVELPAAAAAALVSGADRVERLGFEVEPFGESAVMVRSIPALLAGRDPVPLIRSLADELQGAASESLEESAGEGDDVRMLAAADAIFASLACHSARRFGDHLESEEQRSLLDAVDAIPWAPCCPHGRPVAIAVDISEIERRFRRR